MFSWRTTSCASFGLALPVNTIRLSKAMLAYSEDVERKALQKTCFSASGTENKSDDTTAPSSAVTEFGAGEVGIEPTNAGIKIRCLTTWRLPNHSKCEAPQGMTVQALRHESAHRRRQTTRQPLRVLLGWKLRENAPAGTGQGREARFAHLGTQPR